MAGDTKEEIVRAAARLLNDKKVKKLTVKDIVEECSITRQAFYYHFADIPELMRWFLEQKEEELLRDVAGVRDSEERLRYFFLIAIKSRPYLKRGMETNYGDELERLLSEQIRELFERVADSDGALASCEPSVRSLVARYHSQAVLGILRGWTDEDSARLDEIVHTVYLIISSGNVPFSQK